MPFDFKKACPEFYQAKTQPKIVTLPPVNYLAVRGKGDPNEEDGAYRQAIGLLYGLSYTIKMSKKSSFLIPGYFDYVVPPLEGLWQQSGIVGFDPKHKENFSWISLIRLPDFVTKEVFFQAREEAERKKKQDFSKVEYLSLEEGLCVQMLHLGTYDSEPETVAKMDAFLWEQGYENDFGSNRLHHEIYLSDPRKTAPEKRKTIIRHPIRKQ